ncbi:esterase/lipase family protein [Marininema halotolerans]|uniref:Triacylglycerol esterase/lipase EstA, alpha/beta hydrolase fold n=1 Tax=Marininema halotolerans TaxID=1155944 RepID=A0A1I6U7N5_9BACL|nr:hypothetical protein [Marininema halotolerans]SFS97559.1 Triacylglycerol esterase/lipase EstA, alpha/beta hydrolase fold [Marininema halotolerans]
MKQVGRLALVWVCLLMIALPNPVMAGNGDESVDLTQLKKLHEMGNVLPAGEVASWKTKTKTGMIPGTWYVGDKPSNLDASKHPIVFVQGLGSSALTWIENSGNMYEKAKAQGYETAFVQLYDAAGDQFANNQWKNGEMLAKQIKEISQYYHKKVNVVAHSKGGIDTQTALIYYDADQYVDNVVTLSSPHHGSNLANLSYSWYAGWLADLIGQQSAGTQSLQTGEMDKFRQMTDTRAEVKNNHIYTLAGKDWGSFGSSLYFGGLYLWSYGSNDGAVNVWSSKLTYGSHLYTGSSLNHYSMVKGDVFPRFESVIDDPIVTGAKQSLLLKGKLLGLYPAPVAKKTSLPVMASSQSNRVDQADEINDPGEQYIHGGKLASGKTVKEEVAVESGVNDVIFHVLSKRKVKVKLTSPSGKVYSNQSSAYKAGKGKEFFDRATVQAYRIAKPEAGNWKVEMTSKKNDAYFMLAAFNGADQAFDVDVDTKGSQQDEIPVDINVLDTEKYDPQTVKVAMKVVDSNGIEQYVNQQRIKKLKMIKKKKHRGQFQGEFRTRKQDGVYNITIEINGKMKNGEPFKRTLVRSVHVGN